MRVRVRVVERVVERVRVLERVRVGIGERRDRSVRRKWEMRILPFMIIQEPNIGSYRTCTS